jgi:hypothetical protein
VRHDQTPPHTSANDAGGRKRLVATYDYRDAQGKLRYQVRRYVYPDGRNTFRQCRPDGKGGVIWNLDDVPRVHHLPELIGG